jgi:hypothetical protein
LKATSGGTYDKKDPFIYFTAVLGNHQEQVANLHTHTLVAVNEIHTETEESNFAQVLNQNTKVFLDSGIFNLTNQHARKFNVTMDTALSLAPAEIEGFQELWNTYIRLTTTHHDKLWGFIELDQGGAENKRKTRKRYEEETGLVPIPVYHPINDGWDYFDELCENYDRICFGNIVQARSSVRKRLLTTLLERQKKYPNVWIHVLGYTPNEWLCALPWYGSCDSSSWNANVRYPEAHKSTAALKKFGGFSRGFRVIMNVEKGEENFYWKAVNLAATQNGHFLEKNCRQIFQDRKILK